MKERMGMALAAAVLMAAASNVTVVGQTQAVPDTVAGHVAAAKEAGAVLWPSLVNQLCTPAETPPASPAARGTPPPGPPARDTWFREPTKVFDNMYVFPTADVNAWAVKTSAGIIMLDTQYDYSVKEDIDQNMKTLGLNPADIKDIFITHGHGDHFGGAKYLQELYNPHIYMSQADWDLMAKPPVNPGGNAQPVPKKDMVVTDGQKLTLGDTTITVYITPGHTPGTISFIIPVKINGQPHVAAFWGGTAISRGTGIPALQQYAASARRFEQVVTQAKADIMLSNHERFGEVVKRYNGWKANPTGPNPFVTGTDGVIKYLQVLDHCSSAIVAALKTSASN